MIVSASRRTDIPAYYAGWFLNRLRQGFALVRNPMNPRQVSRVSLSPDVVDGIVFWSKNPAPMLERLDEVMIPYYFQFTVTPYGADVEPGLPHKSEVLDTFRRLADRIGPHRVVWRYDPILVSAAYPVDYHAEQFARMAEYLRGYTSQCTISFLDSYRNTRRNEARLAPAALDEAQMRAIAAAMAPAARACGMALNTCAEAVELADLGVGHARCVDGRIFEDVWGMRLQTKKDAGQRPACGCVQSVDIGAYNTCPHGCLYCYANYNAAKVSANRAAHDPDSPLLIGHLAEGDVVTEREMKSMRVPTQGSFLP